MLSASETLSAKELLTRLASPGHRLALLDVRSESEHEKGAIPGFKSFPILDDRERHQVGITYKEKGKEAAVDLGIKLTSEKRDGRVAAWSDYVLSHGPEQAVVACWRGGLRSRFAAEWLRSSVKTPVLTVEGGYKAIRNELLPLTNLGEPKFLVVTGLTGSKKTELLHEVREAKIDLEHLARHRGSAFGALYESKQPSQATFENRVLFELFRLRASGIQEVLVEDESRLIGNVAIPVPIKERIMASEVVWINSTLEERTQHLAQEYAVDPIKRGVPVEKVHDTLKRAVQRLSRSLGGALTTSILTQMQQAFDEGPSELERHSGWVRELLEKHYDRYYTRSVEKLARPVAFRGTYEECRQWIQTRFA